jgi:dTDP-glucose 4,6-dehydratase
MRLLVTGGCGFIGANYIQYVLRTHPDDVVVNLDKLTYAGNRNNLTQVEEIEGGRRYVFVHGDIADPSLVCRTLEQHSIEAVVNFAAETHVDRSIDDPAPFIQTNVAGTHALLAAARDCGLGLFLHVSTDEVYGSLGQRGKFRESTALKPNSPYAASKAASDLLVRAYHKTYGLPAIVTRCSNNYGPYQFPEKLIPLMYSRAVADEPLPVYGDGLNVRDWIYVHDHCRGVDLALRKGKPGRVYNFGGNAEMRNIDLVRLLLRILGKPDSLVRFVKDRPGHDRRYAMDVTRAERELGWTPEHTFEQGLRQTVRWYSEHRDWLESVRSGAYRTFMQRWYGERT